MMMKRLLHCTLMFMLSVTSGCGFWSAESTTPENPHSIDWTKMSEQLKSLNDKINSEDSAKLVAGQFKQDVQDTLTLFGKEEADFQVKCGVCDDEVLSIAKQARADLQRVVDKLPKENAAATLNDQLKAEIIPLLNSARANVDKAKELAKPTNAWISAATLMLAAQIAAGLLVVVLFAAMLSYLWKRAWKMVEFNMGQVVAGHLAATREAQPDYAPKLTSLSTAQAEMSGRLTELDTEVRSLARFVRESLATRHPDRNPSYSGFNHQSHVEEVTPKDELEFPVYAGDYLGKMNRFANVVRPDFQNGILVNDPDGNGELVLIRDSRDETQPLFVIPRATQFHTKQDFYTYYQKYYDCVRPSAGDVWIIGPAVVEKVTGGWQLREKGMLEVR
jgi:hypothetical protein